MEGLRPLGVGELLDAALRIYRQKFKTLIAAVVVPVLPMMVVAGLVLWSAIPDTSTDPVTGLTVFEDVNVGAFAAALIVVGILYFAAITLSTAACIRAISTAYIGGEATWKTSLSFGFRRTLPLMALTLLTGLGTLAGLPFCIVPGVFLYVAWSMSTPAMLVEDLGPIEAMKRSFRLVQGSWWRVFGILALSSILAGIGQYAVAIPLQIIGAVSGVEAINVGANLVGQIASLVLVQPFSAAMTVALYVDLRVRKEGFDLMLWAQRLGAAPPVGGFPAQPGAPATMPMPAWPGQGYPAPPYGYGQPTPPYDQSPQPYGPPPGQYGPPQPYGQPPAPYGQPPAPYGQPPQPYGQPPAPYAPPPPYTPPAPAPAQQGPPPGWVPPPAPLAPPAPPAALPPASPPPTSEEPGG